MRKFARFLDERGAEHITIELSVNWARQSSNAQQATWSRKLSMIRGFAKYYQSFDNRTQVPPVNLIPCHYQRPTPYIYKLCEIESLMDIAAGLPNLTRKGKGLRAKSYYTLIGLAAVTGLRVHEVIDLKIDSINFIDRTITIEKGKNDRTRIIPIEKTTVAALKEYLILREKVIRRTPLKELFLSEFGRRLSYTAVNSTFRKLCCINAMMEKQGPKPRLHDLRHTFAVRTLIKWYKNGENVQQKMPLLSTFLGHVQP